MNGGEATDGTAPTTSSDGADQRHPPSTHKTASGKAEHGGEIIGDQDQDQDQKQEQEKEAEIIEVKKGVRSR